MQRIQATRHCRPVDCTWLRRISFFLDDVTCVLMIVAKGISLRLVGISCLPALAACMCDLGVAVKFPADVSRKWLLQQKNPVLIKGITKSWPALSGWKLENLGRLHGDVAYRTDPWGGNISLSRFINNEFSADYYMGHVVQYGDCYLINRPIAQRLAQQLLRIN